MSKPKFVEKDVAASRQVWWGLYEAFERDPRGERRILLQNGLHSFLRKHIDKSKCVVSQREVTEILLHIRLRYNWAKQSFDGGVAYKQTDNLVNRLEKIALLAEQLAIETEDIEALHFVGDAALNLKRLSGLRDSEGMEHQDVSTFFGSLVSRVCIDSTVVAEGLSGVKQRASRAGGRPPIVSNSYLILTGMDLYENVFRLGQVGVTGPKEPTGPEDYGGPFFDFIDCYTAVMGGGDFAISKTSTGFGSTVAKVFTQYRKDRELPKRLNPTSDTPSLLLSTNTLASINSAGTRSE